MIARPIVADSTNDGRAQPANIIFQNLESFAVAVTGNDNTPVLHELCEISRFAARRGARVEDFFSWFGIEKLTRDRCAGILNVAITGIESRGWQSVELHKIWIARYRPKSECS